MPGVTCISVKRSVYIYNHFQILLAVDPVNLKLTKIDDDLYKQMKIEFSELDVNLLTNDLLKSEESKKVGSKNFAT